MNDKKCKSELLCIPNGIDITPSIQMRRETIVPFIKWKTEVSFSKDNNGDKVIALKYINLDNPQEFFYTIFGLDEYKEKQTEILKMIDQLGK
jgi:hypothetical protein